jgi:hypothetical protein
MQTAIAGKRLYKEYREGMSDFSMERNGPVPSLFLPAEAATQTGGWMTHALTMSFTASIAQWPDLRNGRGIGWP